MDVSSAVGAVLGGITRVAGALRPAAKPLHPTGRVRRATLVRYGAAPAVGVEFLDTEATDEVVVRESRAAGLPRPLPDVHGLAIRVPNADGTHGDVLLSSTGSGSLTRFLLAPTRTANGRRLSTLIPYDTTAGPVLLAVHKTGGDRLAVEFAVRGGPWRTFGELRLSQGEHDQDITFDAVQNTLPGLAQYAAVRRLREPSYAAARASRGEG